MGRSALLLACAVGCGVSGVRGFMDELPLKVLAATPSGDAPMLQVSSLALSLALALALPPHPSTCALLLSHRLPPFFARVSRGRMRSL